MNLEPFRNLEGEFQALKQQLDRGEISRAEFDAALDKLTLRDEYGREWRIDRVRGDWLLREGDKWVASHPITTPPPATLPPAPPPSKETPATPTSRSHVGVPLIAASVVLLLCVCGVGAFVLLNATGILTTQVNLFPTPTATTALALASATPFASSTSAPPTNVVVQNTATPSATFDNLTPQPTAPLKTTTPTAAQTYVAFDANFFGDDCPLFVGENETRAYACDFGEYTMLHKQATTRYSYWDDQYDDAVIEANGYFIAGTGKYQYGIVFRGNTDGTLYYVFTVTNDGKYNVALYKDGKYTDLIPYTASPIVATGKDMNYFKVVMRGAKFDFYLNDTYLNSVTDTNIARGIAGLFFYNAEPNTEVGFDQFTIATFTPPPPFSRMIFRQIANCLQGRTRRGHTTVKTANTRCCTKRRYHAGASIPTIMNTTTARLKQMGISSRAAARLNTDSYFAPPIILGRSMA
jgi:hypothetical protein